MRLTFRQRVSLSLPSLVLRILLAVVFIWSGLGRVSERYPVSGDTAARLANMGVLRPATASADPPEADNSRPEAEPANEPDEPDDAPAQADPPRQSPTADRGGVGARSSPGR